MVGALKTNYYNQILFELFAVRSGGDAETLPLCSLVPHYPPSETFNIQYFIYQWVGGDVKGGGEVG